jgi:hypothetical protein
MKNDINIAGTRSIQDWEDLENQLYVTKNNHCDRAFKFFEERITTKTPFRVAIEAAFGWTPSA